MKKLLILLILLNLSTTYAECGCAKVNLVNEGYEEPQEVAEETQQQVETVPAAVGEKVIENQASPITGAAVTEVHEGKDDIVYFVPIILFFIALNIFIYLKRKKN